MLTMNKQRKSLAVLAFASALVLSGCGGGGSEDPSASASASTPDPSIADIAPHIPYGDSLASRDVQARETHQTVFVAGTGAQQ